MLLDAGLHPRALYPCARPDLYSDLSSPVLKTSPSVIHVLDLADTFVESGRMTYTL